MTESPLISFEDAANQGTLDAALEISKRRANNLRELRQALERNDDAEALCLARRLVGLNDKEMSGTLARFDRRASRQR